MKIIVDASAGRLDATKWAMIGALMAENGTEMARIWIGTTDRE